MNSAERRKSAETNFWRSALCDVRLNKALVSAGGCKHRAISLFWRSFLTSLIYCDLTRCLLSVGSLCLRLHVNCDKKKTHQQQTNKQKKHRLSPQCIQRRGSKLPCKSLVKCQHESDGRANGNTTGFLTFNWLRLHFVSAWHFVLSFVKCLCLFSDHQPVPACSSRSPNRCQRSNISTYCLNLFVKLKNMNVCSKNQKSENGGRKEMPWCWFSRQSWMIKTAAARLFKPLVSFFHLWTKVLPKDFVLLFVPNIWYGNKKKKQLYWKNFQDSIGHGLSLIFLLCIFFCALEVVCPNFLSLLFNNCYGSFSENEKKIPKREQNNDDNNTLPPATLFELLRLLCVRWLLCDNNQD